MDVWIMCMWTYACTYAHINACICTYACMRMWIQVYVCAYVWTHLWGSPCKKRYKSMHLQQVIIFMCHRMRMYITADFDTSRGFLDSYRNARVYLCTRCILVCIPLYQRPTVCGFFENKLDCMWYASQYASHYLHAYKYISRRIDARYLRIIHTGI